MSLSLLQEGEPWNCRTIHRRSGHWWTDSYYIHDDIPCTKSKIVFAVPNVWFGF